MPLPSQGRNSARAAALDSAEINVNDEATSNVSHFDVPGGSDAGSLFNFSHANEGSQVPFKERLRRRQEKNRHNKQLQDFRKLIKRSGARGSTVELV